MTTRYRVEYALKTHRRDQFIEWIKGLLAVPFVLHTSPPTIPSPTTDALAAEQAVNKPNPKTARDRYCDILTDVEALLDDHIRHIQANTPGRSKLKQLVPSIGFFWTPLALRDAFVLQDAKRHISSRRVVAPSFNDVRVILNSAQALALFRARGLELVTFDGDVTLYDDGAALDAASPIVPKLLGLLARGTKIGIVTAAGYTEARRYAERLSGLLETVRASELDAALKRNLIVMGGESNFMFQYDDTCVDMLVGVPFDKWALPEMAGWTQARIDALLDAAEAALKSCVAGMQLHATILRKERAVGIVPIAGRLPREALEETVLVTQQVLESSAAGQAIPFCAFNGGNDVFVDIGDKSLGVRACQRFFGGIAGAATLHVGDQFLSAGANDFKARQACTTAWIASPTETMELLDEIAVIAEGKNSRGGGVE